MEDGEWVQDYTMRGAPRQGHRKYRWVSKKEKRLEIIAAWVIAAVMVLAVIAPIIFNRG